MSSVGEDDSDRIRVFCRIKPSTLQNTTSGNGVTRCVRTAGSGPFILPSTIGSEISFQEYPPVASNVVEIAKRNVVNPQRFFFDGVLGEDCSQKDCFDMVAQPLVRSLVAGFNAAIIAYGQTGSGKTYTILGPPEQHQQPHTRPMTNPGDSDDSLDGIETHDNSRLIYQGLLPRVLERIIDLDHIHESYGDDGFGQVLPAEWRCSCFEIYRNRIFDLLCYGPDELHSRHREDRHLFDHDTNRKRQLGLHIREDPTIGPYVEGLREISVTTAQEALELVRLSMKARATSETHLNHRSSRSHLIFQLRRTQRRIEAMRVRSPQRSQQVPVDVSLVDSTVHRSPLSEPLGSDGTYQATKVHSNNSVFSFVDLAGSERLKDSGSAGARKVRDGGTNRSFRLRLTSLFFLVRKR